MRAAGWILGLLILAILLLALAVHLAWIRIPPNWAPWGQVYLDEEPSWLARLQLNSLATNPQACLATLGRSHMAYTRVPDRPMRDGCGLEAGVRITRSHLRYGNTFQSTCAMAAGLYWYEAAIAAAARRHFGTGIARIEHLGSYACRNIAGSAGRRSEHATANALDIAGFRLENGDDITVRRDWGADSAKGRFLADVHALACTFFNTVLGPDYNAAHADHFHLDLGPARICR